MSVTWNERYPIPHLPKQSPDIYTELKKAGFGDSESHHKGGTVSAFNRKEENKPVQNQVNGLTDQGRSTMEPFFIACQLCSLPLLPALLFDGFTEFWSKLLGIKMNIQLVRGSHLFTVLKYNWHPTVVN